MGLENQLDIGFIVNHLDLVPFAVWGDPTKGVFAVDVVGVDGECGVLHGVKVADFYYYVKEYSSIVTKSGKSFQSNDLNIDSIQANFSSGIL